MRFEVIFYEKENGDCPVQEFLDSLNIKMRAKVLQTIKLLEANGYKLRKPYSEHLEDGIFELRTKFGTDITRVLYFFFIGQRVILTNGFVKKTQKTPPPEIELAKKRRTDFLSREENKQ